MFCLQIWWLDTLIDSMMKISITSLLNSLFILLSPTLGFGTGRSPTGGLISQQNVRNEESLTNVSSGHSHHPETQVMTQEEQIQGDIRHFTTLDKALLSHISRKLCVSGTHAYNINASSVARDENNPLLRLDKVEPHSMVLIIRPREPRNNTVIRWVEARGVKIEP